MFEEIQVNNTSCMWKTPQFSNQIILNFKTIKVFTNLFNLALLNYFFFFTNFHYNRNY